jgi:hypothetical protein
MQIYHLATLVAAKTMKGKRHLVMSEVHFGRRAQKMTTSPNDDRFGDGNTDVAIRETRLGNFSPNGQLFTFCRHFYEICRSSPYFLAIFHKVKVMH